MTVADRCPSCGAERPANSPEGLCPRCLMQQALETDPPDAGTGPGVELTVSLEPGSTSVLARIAESIGGVPHVLLRDTDPAAGPDPASAPAATGMPGPASRTEKYQLFGEIARGGMGAVLRGRDVDLGRDLAVKVLLEAHQQKPDLVKRFVEEAQIGGQLQHPGVVPVYELGAFADRRPFFTMKLVKGRTLAELLKERPDPADDRPRFLAIFAQVCQTMAYAHARGVIHRDLKPSNIMVGSFGEVQVMDWGLAKILPGGGAADDSPEPPTAADQPVSVIRTARSDSDADASRSGSILGTPGYMAPEQARGEVEAVDERVDVFGLGAIVCEVLTGEPAFTGRSTGETMRKASRGELAEAFGRLDGCGAEPELIRLAKDCLAPEREDRPRTARVVADRVTAYLAGVQERLRAAELARVEAQARAEEEAKRRVLADRLAAEAGARAVAESKRRRATMALAASVLALAVLGGSSAAYYIQQRQARSARAELALNEVRLLLDQADAQSDDPARWQAADSALAGAGRAVDELGDAEAVGRLSALRDTIRAGGEAARRDRLLLSELSGIRSARQDVGLAATDAAYARSFARAELDLDALPADRAAARLAGRPAAVKAELAAFLDDWSSVRREAGRAAERWRRPLRAARAADPDDYRGRIRSALEFEDLKAQLPALRALAADPHAGELPPASATLLAMAMATAGDRDSAAGLLAKAVERHPSDLWVNFDLAVVYNSLIPARPDEAIRYFTAARALRPTTSHPLGHALQSRGRLREAVAVFRELERLQPDEDIHTLCLGSALGVLGETRASRLALERATAGFRAAAAARPDDPVTLYHLAMAMHGLGYTYEAIAASRRAIDLRPDWAMARSQLGVLLSDVGRGKEAEVAFREALRLEPGLFEARGNLATQLQYQGRLVEAIAEFRDLTRQAPHLASLHYNLGNALWKRGDHGEAAAEMREALRLEPEHIEALINLGCIQCDTGAIDQGIASLRDAIRRRPDHPKAWGNLVTALRKKGDIDGLRDLARRKPEFPQVHAELGRALFDRGRYAEALEPLGKAVELDPDSGWALTILGTCQSRLGRHDEAIATFRRALERTPDDAEAHQNLGSALYAKGEYAAALAAFRQGLRLKADDPHSHANLANALLATGDVDGAIAAYERAIRLDPAGADHRYWLGSCLERKGRGADAIAAYREAVRLRPDFPEARNHLALVLYLAGQVEEAIRTAREAIRLHPDQADARYNLGTFLQKEGRGDEAIAELREAVRLDPNHPEALCNLGQALKARGRFEEALGYLRRGHAAGTKRGGWNYPSADWVAECERMVAGDRRLSAVLKGEDRAEDNAQRVLLADVALARGWYATAARFRAEAIAADPAADPEKSTLRYRGACCAALAGCGKGKDEPAPDAAARARLRREAVDWLKADLAGWSKVLVAGTPEDRATVPRALAYWKADPELAGIRDEGALELLPEDEQKTCRALWAEVDTLLKKSQGR